MTVPYIYKECTLVPHFEGSSEVKMLAVMRAIILFSYFVSLETHFVSDCIENCKCDSVLNKKTVNCNLMALTEFNLSRITPDENVTMLFLSGNELQDTDGGEIGRTFPNLTFLESGNNLFEELTNTSFVSLKNLIVLLLYDNKIERIDKDTFKDQKKLERLDLSNNKLKVVDSEWLKPMIQLKDLNLESNVIEDFKPTMFVWPLHLEKLSLKDNKIKIMPPLPAASNCVVDLQNNSISCLCKRRDAGNKIPKLHLIGGCQEFLTVEKLRFISICIPPEIKGNFRKINDGFILQCKWKGFPYPEVQLRSSDKVLALSHGNQSKLSHGLGEEYGNYTCQAQNVVGLAVYNIVIKDELITKINEITEEMPENVSSFLTEGEKSNVHGKDGLKGLLTMLCALLGSFVVSLAALTVIRYKFNI